MIDFLFGNVALNISSNPFLFLEIFIVFIMSMIVALPIWVFELHQTEKNWLAADTTRTSEPIVSLMRKQCTVKPIAYDANYCSTPRKVKHASETSVETLDVYSEIDLIEVGQKMLDRKPAEDHKSLKEGRHQNGEIIDMKKEFRQDIPHVTRHTWSARSIRQEPASAVYRLYDIIKSTFVSEFEPLTINLFQTNITSMDVKVGIDSRIPTSLTDLERPATPEQEAQGNYISRQLRLFCSDHGDTSEDDYMRLKEQVKEQLKDKSELIGVPIQIGSVSGLLNNQNWVGAGQSLTENAFSLVKILQNFAHTERDHRRKADKNDTSGHHKINSYGGTSMDQQTTPGQYLARSFFTKMNRNNPQEIPRAPLQDRTRRLVHQFHRDREFKRRDDTSSSDSESSSAHSTSRSYANLGFMCR